MEDWQDDWDHAPIPLKLAPARRSLLAADDLRFLAKLAVKVIVVTAAVLWTAFVLGAAVGLVKLSFCVLAGCR